jgi:DHA2 family multidrug resistance protein
MNGAQPPAVAPKLAGLLVIVFLLTGIEFLQSGMIAFGAGAIMGQINASPEQFVLTVVAYAAVAITTISVQHWLVERLGWRAYLQWSVALFVAGGVICASSDGYGQFLLGRCVMALGGAGFMTAARLLINLLPPSPARMKGIGAFGSALALGNALAPWVAAKGVDIDHWELIFAVPAVMAVLAALIATRVLPETLTCDADRSQAHPLLAAAILCASLFGLYGLQRAAFDFYANAVPLLLCVAAAAAIGAAVLWQQHGHARPLLAVARLVQPRYLAGMSLFAFCYVILGANNTMLPVLLQRALGAPFIAIGQVQTLGLLSSLAAFAGLIAVLKKSPAPRKFYVLGFACLAGFAWQLARLNAGAHLVRDVLPAIVCFGVFLILVLATTAIHTFTNLQTDPVAFNHGQMIKNMMSQVGIALGIAGATLGLQWRTAEHSTVLAQRFVDGDPVFTALRDQLAAQGGVQLATAQLGQMLNQQAALLAGIDYFSLLMVVAGVSAVGMLLQRVFR